MGTEKISKLVITTGIPLMFSLLINSLYNLVDPIFIFGMFGLPRLETTGAAIAVFGICARIQGVVTVGVHGVNNGLIPIVAYNYGAGNKSRISDAVKWGVIYGIALFIVFFMLLELLPMQMLGMFDASELMMEIGIPVALTLWRKSFNKSVVCSIS